jgi:hypothetical protein
VGQKVADQQLSDGEDLLDSLLGDGSESVVSEPLRRRFTKGAPKKAWTPTPAWIRTPQACCFVIVVGHRQQLERVRADTDI